jgi:DUF1009 family protein
MPLKADNSSRTLGLIAGMGDLPKAVASEAKRMGYKVVAVALQPPADESLKPFADDFHKIKIGRLGGLITLLKKLSITEAVMAGKVPKGLIYKNKKDIIPDLTMARVFFSLKNLSDDTIMNGFVGELEKNGVMLHKTITFTENLLCSEGVLTTKKPSRKDLQNIDFGWSIAKEMGKLDIGQTVVVKNMAVMAIEAIEGTDEAIKRGGNLAQKDAVVIKVSKPGQDMRFDVPVLGLDSLDSMKACGAKVLAFEAGQCIIVDKANFIKKADKYGLVVAAVKK